MARGDGLRAKKGDFHCAAWPTDPQKTFDFMRKTSIFGKPLFCIQRWLGSCLETSCGRLGATPTGPGGVSPRIGPHPCDSEPAESHKVSGWQNETPMVPERVTQGCFFFFSSPDGSRWRPQSEKGGMFTAQLGHPTLKNPLFSLGKQVFLQNRSFASKDGWDRLLGPLLDVLEPLEGARGSGSTHLVATGPDLGAVGPLIWWEQFGSMGLSHKQWPKDLTRPGPLARRILQGLCVPLFKK